MARDGAVSETIGTVLMIAMVVVMAGVVYYFVGRGDQGPHAPTAVALTQAGSTATTRTFTIATTSQPIHWNEIALKLSGKPMTYDDTLILPATYCVVETGSDCTTTSAWNATGLVKAGQQLKIHDSALSGKTLLLILPDANAAVVSINLS